MNCLDIIELSNSEDSINNNENKNIKSINN